MGNSNKLNMLNYEIERWGTEKVDQRPTEINCSTHNQKLP